MQDADFIIVGAGTAGLVLASRLIQETSARVLVLEVGPRYPKWALDAPLAGLRLRKAWSWTTQTVPQKGLGGRTIPIPMGRLAGGTSAVNAMIAAIGPSADFDAWEKAGCTGWEWEALLPFWERATLANKQGIMPVNPPTFVSDFSHAFLEACQQEGCQKVENLTGSPSETCGLFDVFQQKGKRISTAHALKPLQLSNRFQIMTGKEVSRILLEGEKVIGVEVGEGRSRNIIRTRHGVVISAGAFFSPQILQRSGIGPARLLSSARLKVQVDLPGVGLNLQDHFGAPVVIQSTKLSPGRKSRWISAALRYLFFGTGVMASNCCEAGCFFSGQRNSPDLELLTLFQTNRHPHAVELASILMHPESKGTVTIDPRNPSGPPLIDPQYLTAPGDADLILKGVERIRSIVNRPALRQFGLTTEILPGSMELGEFLRLHASTYHHPVGTCRMGSDDLAVVDPGLKVRGVNNLWVVDNSIIPAIPAAHTAATAIVIAEKAADLLKKDISRI